MLGVNVKFNNIGIKSNKEFKIEKEKKELQFWVIP